MSAEVIINGRRIPLSKREVKDLKGITMAIRLDLNSLTVHFRR